MLKLDLRQLERKGRLSIEADVPATDPLLRGLDLEFRGPLEVCGEAQFAGRDALVRGRIAGQVELPCRRCLNSVAVPVHAEVAFLFRPGLTEAEAEDAEVYRLPENADELDLGGPVREELVLAVPRYAICSETCRGLCPHCGANLNQEQCRCGEAEPDERWAALRSLRTE